jgi:hypothetical protein
MEIRNFCTFEAEFPDDGQWDDRGNVIASPGRNVAEAILTNLKLDNFVLVYPPENREDFGWQFLVKVDDLCSSLLIQGGKPWLLIVSPDFSLFSRLFVRDCQRRTKRLMDRIHHVLENDAKIANILWYSTKEYWNRMPGHATP